MKISYFVHSTTTDNEKNISSGWSDPILSETGVQQARELGTLVDANKFETIYVSDTIRTITTAYLAFPDHKSKIVIDQRLRECNYGDFDGEASETVEPLQEKAIKKPFPNGESYEQVKQRVEEFLHEISLKHENEHIAIISSKAPQLALEVITNKKNWQQAFAEDWRKTKNWQPGWFYKVNN